MFKDAKIGDKVWHLRHGWMKILDIIHDNNHPIKAGIKEVMIDTFTFEGKAGAADLNPSLFWDEIKFEIPPKPLPKLEVDAKVLVWDNNNYLKLKRHFSHFNEDGKIMVFRKGATSWTNDGFMVPFDNWKLYDETKGIQ